ncbi:Putative Arginyl tRNA synthetase, anticodon binding [Planktothrix tepida]|uniref:Arginyl tRNA synthetase, anticodon binding n=2 Tax=Planktothrix TaxID=54304 RepID=A0A9W4CDN6_9CYAN|nr:MULTISPECIES: DALR anticodon-binding domain-containing protein [Planktothrix]CAD5910984.1 Putative Arginyl tRNA synthetase, anticodon binding [Planktothrix pseudagardhii]CAD5911553.1 Putative Arginyl tRNA synthetase, anticodon binding [Planktothrix tepida]CUR32052.1 putative Arginyl tRNA synthetase, anticodon binding [Planktothrix tepida PCC 9214]
MLALAKVLTVQLGKSLRFQGIDTVDSQEIPVNHIKHETQITYGSAIALKLSSRLHQPALDLAEAICVSLKTLNAEEQCGFGQIPTDVTVYPLSSGMLQFIFTDVGIATWLEQLLRHRWTLTPLRNREISLDQFEVQYSHARCCSLLSLADREHLIQLEETNLRAVLPLKISFTSSPIPWLTDQGQLQFTQSYDYQLLMQLVKTVDALFFPLSSPHWLKLAVQLSENFQQFYRHCRIWGEVKQQTPELAQARLGLVLITQVILQILLEEKLGIMAPFEL